ncbi:MAG: hypothetical protein A2X49_11535 [Lentisphaerae bacterium GWF2_52_8]|nr:MAG: hypothetical protein A2X49_11535 [Lentisphaerae bacterium GWF2_52_8]
MFKPVNHHFSPPRDYKVQIIFTVKFNTMESVTFPEPAGAPDTNQAGLEALLPSLTYLLLEFVTKCHMMTMIHLYNKLIQFLYCFNSINLV